MIFLKEYSKMTFSGNQKSNVAYLTFAVLWSRSLFHLLNEEVKHLCLYKLLHKLSCAFGLYRFTEIKLLEFASLVLSFPCDVLRKVAHGLDKEWQKSFWNHPVQLLKTWMMINYVNTLVITVNLWTVYTVSRVWLRLLFCFLDLLNTKYEQQQFNLFGVCHIKDIMAGNVWWKSSTEVLCFHFSLLTLLQYGRQSGSKWFKCSDIL